MAGVGLRQLGSRLIDVGGDVRCCHSVQAQGNYETGKYTGTEPGIVDKRLQTHIPIASATQSVLITSRYRGTHQAQIVPSAQIQPPADEAKYLSLIHI